MSSTTDPRTRGIRAAEKLEDAAWNEEGSTSFATQPSQVRPDSSLATMSVQSQSRSASPTASPPPSTIATTANGTPDTPPPSTSTPQEARAALKKALKAPPQLIGDLPVARDEAMSTFSLLEENVYQYKTLGQSRELEESMVCDCMYDPDDDLSPEAACGPHSECINRLTQVECLAKECKCRRYCQNQRFQKRQYSPMEIVKTEKKGFGLRAEADIPKDSFIYEYIGDVVSTPSFKKRMKTYADEGIEHFYFMMLQKDEFIDATKNGCPARFANHSCNPNCYVAKWTIGRYVRMGIFAKRKIRKWEELTFNYNVDRYGHQAQICYCGEPNCVGFIGGKTQTDISAIDDLYLDALGITDEADLLELKGSKKKKGKKLDDPDFMPVMRAIILKEVPKVVQAVRQTQSKKMLFKLLSRIKLTGEEGPLRQIMRLRGYSLMKNILDDYAEDISMLVLTLECMRAWPLVYKNKVEDSHILGRVQELASHQDESISAPAKQLFDHWESLPVGYRIPKRAAGDDDEFSSTPFVTTQVYCETDVKIPIYRAPDAQFILRPQQKKQRIVTPPDLKFLEDLKKSMALVEAHTVRVPRAASNTYFSIPPSQRENHRDMIIENARVKAEAEEAAKIEAARLAALEEGEKMEKKLEAENKAKERAERKAKRKQALADKKLAKKAQTAEQKEENKEKRLLKLIGAVVVKCMSKYGKDFDKDSFKKYAKELTNIIADKEKKSSSYKDAKLEALSEEKVAKIKKFSKDYIAKVIHKRKSKAKQKSLSAGPSSSSVQSDTPVDMTNADAEVNGEAMVMSVEEAMGMDDDASGTDDDANDGEEDDDDDEERMDEDDNGDEDRSRRMDMDVDKDEPPLTVPLPQALTV